MKKNDGEKKWYHWCTIVILLHNCVTINELLAVVTFMTYSAFLSWWDEGHPLHQGTSNFIAILLNSAFKT